jgi:cellulose synthase/poly-beta-1,6-N-acetylglucosamine synthase-like glycosyltransferase
MIWLFELLLIFAAIVLLIPCAFFLLLIVLGLRSTQSVGSASRKIAPADVRVLIPAHNEEGVLPLLLGDLGSQLPLSQVLVVVDNCSDGTADVARSLGAAVTERQDLSRRGKAFALVHGIDVLAAEPPKTIIIIDADCRVGPGVVERLTAIARTTGRPVQAEYVLERHPDAGPGQRVSAFAAFLINSVRQRGLKTLGAPVRLNGTGMALPWEHVTALPRGSAHLVEDMMLGVDLAMAGASPVFAPGTVVRSPLPASQAAEVTQRQRWEEGHVDVLMKQVPRLLGAGLRGRPRLILSAIDIGIPPLTRLLAALAALFAISLSFALLTGSWAPFWLGALATGMTTLGVALGLWRYRWTDPDALSGRAFLEFARLKLKVLRAGRPEGWVRTGRDHDQ